MSFRHSDLKDYENPKFRRKMSEYFTLRIALRKMFLSQELDSDEKRVIERNFPNAKEIRFMSREMFDETRSRNPETLDCAVVDIKDMGERVGLILVDIIQKDGIVAIKDKDETPLVDKDKTPPADSG